MKKILCKTCKFYEQNGCKLLQVINKTECEFYINRIQGVNFVKELNDLFGKFI